MYISLIFRIMLFHSIRIISILNIIKRMFTFITIFQFMYRSMNFISLPFSTTGIIFLLRFLAESSLSITGNSYSTVQLQDYSTIIPGFKKAWIENGVIDYMMEIIKNDRFVKNITSSVIFVVSAHVNVKGFLLRRLYIIRSIYPMVETCRNNIMLLYVCNYQC